MSKKNQGHTRSVSERSIEIVYMLSGIASAAIGLEFFLLPSHFVDGGVMGISLITNAVTGVNLSILVLLINLPFLYLGYKQVGTAFAIRSSIAMTILALILYFVDVEGATHDKLLISLFGGFFLGGGIGLCIRGGCVIDGTEILAIAISRQTSLTVGDVILVINLIIFSVTAFVFSLETALYAIVTYFSAAKTIDFVIQGIEEYTGVTIVSEKNEEIRRMILYVLARGVTIYKGERGYRRKDGGNNEINILFTIVTRLEIQKLKGEVEKIDPKAFIVMNPIGEIRGGLIKKRPLHKD